MRGAPSSGVEVFRHIERRQIAAEDMPRRGRDDCVLRVEPLGVPGASPLPHARLHLLAAPRKENVRRDKRGGRLEGVRRVDPFRRRVAVRRGRRVADRVGCGSDMAPIRHPGAAHAVERLDDVEPAEHVAEIESDECGGQGQRIWRVRMELRVKLRRIDPDEPTSPEKRVRDVADDEGHAACADGAVGVVERDLHRDQPARVRHVDLAEIRRLLRAGPVVAGGRVRGAEVALVGRRRPCGEHGDLLRETGGRAPAGHKAVEDAVEGR